MDGRVSPLEPLCATLPPRILSQEAELEAEVPELELGCRHTRQWIDSLCHDTCLTKHGFSSPLIIN